MRSVSFARKRLGDSLKHRNMGEPRGQVLSVDRHILSPIQLLLPVDHQLLTHRCRLITSMPGNDRRLPTSCCQSPNVLSATRPPIMPSVVDCPLSFDDQLLSTSGRQMSPRRPACHTCPKSPLNVSGPTLQNDRSSPPLTTRRPPCCMFSLQSAISVLQSAISVLQPPKPGAVSSASTSGWAARSRLPAYRVFGRVVCTDASCASWISLWMCICACTGPRGFLRGQIFF